MDIDQQVQRYCELRNIPFPAVPAKYVREVEGFISMDIKDRRRRRTKIAEQRNFHVSPTVNKILMGLKRMEVTN